MLRLAGVPPGAAEEGARRSVAAYRARHGAAVTATALLRMLTPASHMGARGFAVAGGGAPAVRACVGRAAVGAGCDRAAALRAMAAGDAAAAAAAAAGGGERAARRASRGAAAAAQLGRLVELGVGAEWAEALRPIGGGGAGTRG